MDAIILTVEISKDRHLVIDLPPDFPVGTAQITIQPQDSQLSPSVINPAREAVRAKLLAAGILSNTHQAPEGTTELSSEERKRVWGQFASDQSIDDLINEDRDEVAANNAIQQDILRQDRLRTYDRARRYWQSVNDDRQHLSNEEMDSQFWLIDHNGIPRLKDEQATVVLPPDPLEQMLKLAEADHSIQWRTEAKRNDDGGTI